MLASDFKQGPIYMRWKSASDLIGRQLPHFKTLEVGGPFETGADIHEVNLIHHLFFLSDLNRTPSLTVSRAK